MITFLSPLRKFEGGQAEVIQRSAIYTWQANGIPIIASSYDNIGIVVSTRRENDIGLSGDAVILPDLIKAGLNACPTNMMALINSDILITPSFREKFEDVVRNRGQDIFLTGSRYDIKLSFQIDSAETYEKAMALSRSMYNPESSADVFIASVGVWKSMVDKMPLFVHGRCAWDNWIHSWARKNVQKYFNCTNALVTLHCDHPHITTKGHPSVDHNYSLFSQSGLTGERINTWPQC